MSNLATDPRGKPTKVAPRNLKAVLSKIFDWAADRGVLPGNPAAGVKLPTAVPAISDRGCGHDAPTSQVQRRARQPPEAGRPRSIHIDIVYAPGVGFLMPVRYSSQGVRFEWDANKAAANRRKHGIDFEQGCEAFFDPFLRVVDAGQESGEAREAILGLTVRWQLLYVVFVERGEVFRIISARRATRAERRVYEDQ